jgi:hypothetical protein
VQSGSQGEPADTAADDQDTLDQTHGLVLASTMFVASTTLVRHSRILTSADLTRHGPNLAPLVTSPATKPPASCPQSPLN